MQPFFLRTAARHPVRRLHAAPWVGSQKRDHHRLCRWHHTGEVSSSVVHYCHGYSEEPKLTPRLLVSELSPGDFYYSFKCSSHYFGISQVATWMSINEIITTHLLCVIASSAASLQSKLWTVNWALLGSGHPYTACTPHTHLQMILLLYYYLVLWDVRVRRCICECTGYYVELHLILPLVMCLSHRYGRQSTPEHNYLALQKSPYPQGKTKQRETVMAQAVRWEYLHRLCVGL